MFLHKLGSSGKFRFDEIYSALQKGLRRGDLNLSLEMGKEFKEYPNALKKRLIQNCCEDCPNIYLINDIFNTKPNLEELIKFIPAICSHVKCREVLYGFRVVCERDYNFEDLSESDNDLLIILSKCFTILCKNDNNADSIIDFFQKLIPDIKLKRIYNFISKNRTFIYMLCGWKCIPYITNKNYEKPELKNFKIDKYNIKTLPEYIYDKHVNTSPREHKTYEYFINNCVLFPRMEETEIEKLGKKLYITSNKGTSEFIKPIINNSKVISDNIKVIQVQLITAKHKPRTYFCDINNNGEYNGILKGPYNSFSQMDPILKSDYIKQKLNMSSPHFETVKWKKDMYLYCDNFIKVNENETIRKKSKLEDTIVYNGELFLFNHDLLDELNKDQIIELFKVFVFRKAIGTNDTCTRNIIFYNGIISSIDDPLLLKETDYIYKVKLSKNIKEKYEILLKKYFKHVKRFIRTFYKEIKDDKEINNETKEFITNRLLELIIYENWHF